MHGGFDAGAPDVAFLSGGGEMGALMRAHDWASTPLGAPEAWAPALKTAVRLILNTGHRMYIWWGPDLLCFYNDAYRRTLGPERHPGSLGRPGREVWAEIWHLIGHQVDFVMAGHGSTWDENRPVPITRFGRLDEIYWTYSYSPIDDETAPNGVGGVLVVCTETTQAVLAERRLTSETERQRRLFDQAPGFITILTGPEHVFEFVNESYDRLFERRDFVGNTVREAFPELDGQGFYELLDRVYATGERFVASAMPIRLQAASEAEPTDRFLDFIYEPVRDEGGAVTGIFVEGYDVTERVRAEAGLRDAEERYLALFNAIDQGFCTIEVAFDENDVPVDYRFLEISPSFERQTGIANGAGRWMREIAPNQDQFWFDTYGHVALTGEPARFENHSTPLGRWWDVYAFRISGPHRIAVLFRDITDQKRAEQALRESEARLAFLDRLSTETATLADADAVLATTTRLLGEHLNLSVCAYADMDEDQDGFTIRGDWAAPGSESIVGHYSLADFGKLAVKNLTAGLPLIVNDNLCELAPEEAATFQNIGIAATICMPLVKEGRLTALMAIHDRVPRQWTEAELNLLREVTARSWAHVERVATIAELRESEARLRALNADLERKITERALGRSRTWQLSPEIMGVLNADGYFEQSNPAWGAVLGWSETEVASTRFFDFIHPDDLAKTQAAWAAAMEGGEPALRFENRYRTKDGDWRWLSWVAVPDDGKVYCSARDITDEKEREAALAERTAERNRMWQTSPDLLLVVGFDGVFRRVNPAWTAILGYEEHELVGTRVDRLVHREDVELTEKALAAAAGGPLPLVENRYRHKDGSYRWISWITAPPENGLIYATGRHVTAEKERQAELEAAQEQLRQAQKMEAVGQLTGGVAHDFNNLLTIIKSSTDLLRRPGLPEERRARYVEAISDTVDRASKLTGQLLAFARRQSLKPEVFNVADRIRSVAEMLRTIVGSRIQIETEIACETCFVEVDVSQFETALVNMTVNARDAMDGGGRLTVRVEGLSAMPQIRGHGGGRGRFVAVSVSDTGHGIPADRLAQIFEPFFTTKEVGKGTGLGLSQVFGFAKQSGGDVAVESEVDRGSTFTLYLPRTDADGTIDTIASQEGSEPAEHGRGRRVLVVEDNVEVGQFSTQLLQDLGYETSWASNANEALRLLSEVNGFDAVFSDVVMPGMSGIELGHEIRRRYPDLPVVLTSGYSHMLAEEGSHGFELLHKPYAVKDLSRVLRRVTLHRSPIPLKSGDEA